MSRRVEAGLGGMQTRPAENLQLQNTADIFTIFILRADAPLRTDYTH